MRANIFSATYDKRHISDYMSISTNEINIFKAIGNNVDIEKLLESNELYDTILKNRISQSLKNPYKNLPNRLKEITQKVLNTNGKVEANFARRF